jgi:hypothetical protein
MTRDGSVRNRTRRVCRPWVEGSALALMRVDALVVTTLAEQERGSVIVELTEMVEHERKIASTAALAASAGRPDPSAPDLLQRVATEDAAAVFGSASSRPTAPARARDSVPLERRRSGSSVRRRRWRLVTLYIFRREPNSRAAQSGQRTTVSTDSSSRRRRSQVRRPRDGGPRPLRGSTQSRCCGVRARDRLRDLVQRHALAAEDP